MLAEAGVRVLGIKRIDQQRRSRPGRSGLEVRVKPRRNTHLLGNPKRLHKCFSTVSRENCAQRTSSGKTIALQYRVMPRSITFRYKVNAVNGSFRALELGWFPNGDGASGTHVPVFAQGVGIRAGLAGANETIIIWIKRPILCSRARPNLWQWRQGR